MNTEINVTNEIINIDTTTSVIDVNVTNDIIVIEATQGAYPLPATVYSVFGRTGDIVALNGDYSTSLVTEGTNLYFTTARARGSLSAGTGIGYSSLTGVISNTAPDQTVTLTSGSGIGITGTYPSFTIASTITQYTDALARAAISLTTIGTSGAATYSPLTGVLNIPQYAPDLSGYVPTSRTLTINGTTYDLSANRSWEITSMIYPSAGIAVSTGTAWGTSITNNSANWNTAYNRSIVSAAVTGTTTKTLTLNEQDGSTITASWTDINTDAVTSVFGRTGAIVATSGDYSTNQVTENTNLYFTDARARTAISLTTTGTSGVSTYNPTTGVFNIPNYSTDLSGYVPYTGATTNVNLGIYNITAAAIIKNGGVDTQFLKADGSIDNNTYLTANDLPSTLSLYATTAAASVGGYFKLVTTIDDPDFNTTAVDVSTGVITATDQLISSLISPVNLINGNPGVFNVTTYGNIKKVSGSGESEFYFKIYKRSSAGVETLVGTSSNTIPVVNTGYSEFFATAVWNDGDFGVTDTIVLKYYATRISGGSNPTYNFQFGGTSPVRTIVPIPTAVIPNIYLEELADVEDGIASNNDGIYYDSAVSLWKYKSIAEVLGYTPANQASVVPYTGATGSVTLGANSITAASLIKSGGTSAEILAADGSVITAGTNITISGGTISASGGGGGSMAIGGAITGATTGSVLFVNSGATLAQDNANFFWDDTNNELGLGTSTPTARLNVSGSTTASAGFALSTVINPTLVAAANSDKLIALDVTPTFTTGAFTGLSSLAARFSGNVIMGTIPSSVVAYTYVPLTLSNNATGAIKVQLSLVNGGGNTGAGSAIDFFTYTDVGNGLPGVRILSVDDGLFSGNFQILTKAQGGSGTGALSTKLQINGGTGNLGIGTTTIGSKLQVNGNAAIGYSASTAAPTNGLVVSGIVGIGTTTTKAYSSLTVQGQIVANSNFCINANQSLRMNMYYNASPSQDRAMTTGYSGDFILNNTTGDWQIRTTSATASADTNITTMTTRLTIAATGAAAFASTVKSTQYLLSALNTAPATSTSTGTLGEIRVDAGAIYVCTATNTWVRALLTTF